jgi:toxin ParE1/3/4
MAYRVEWSPRAVEDLEAIAQYIGLDSSAYAAAVLTKILKTTRHLSRFPLAGRMVPEFSDDRLREWFVYSYHHSRQATTTSLTASLKQQLQPKLNMPRVASGGDAAEGRGAEKVVGEVEVWMVK